MSQDYLDLFLTVLRTTHRDHQDVEAWGKNALQQTEQLIKFVPGRGIERPAALPPPEPGAQPPEVVAEVVAPAATIAAGHPLGPAFDGWDAGQLRVILTRVQELALAKHHNAEDEAVSGIVLELFEAIDVLREMWVEASAKK